MIGMGGVIFYLAKQMMAFKKDNDMYMSLRENEEEKQMIFSICMSEMFLKFSHMYKVPSVHGVFIFKCYKNLKHIYYAIYDHYATGST